MTDRGTYRSIHTAIIDDPDFQDLSFNAKLVFFYLKLQLGPSGIGVVYQSTLEAQIGCHSDIIRDAMTMLCERDWIRREKHVVWIKNGLKYDPSISTDNINHRKSLLAYLRGLPKLCVVNTYADYYGLEKPFPGMACPMPSSMPSSMPSEGDALSGNTEYGIRNTEERSAKTVPPVPPLGGESSWIGNPEAGEGPDVRSGDPGIGEGPDVRSGDPGIGDVRSGDDPGAVATTNGEEGRRKAKALSGFEAFWQIYPRRVGKDRARLVWQKRRLERNADELISAVNEQILFRAKAQTLGVWMPEWKHPSTWLQQGCWQDEIPMTEELLKCAKKQDVIQYPII